MGWQNFPMIECPHCGKEIQVDDYYDLKGGDSFYCKNCEGEIYVWATDVTISGDIHGTKEQ